MTDDAQLDRIIDAHVYFFHENVNGQDAMQKVVREDYPALATAILRRMQERRTEQDD